MIAVVVVTMAMIIVFSALNGFEDLVKNLYNSFYPELIVKPANGKVFEYNSSLQDKTQYLAGIRYISETLEEKALLKHGEEQAIVTIKGVDTNYQKVSGLQDRIVRGQYLLEDQFHRNYVILGAGIEYRLGVNVQDQLSQLSVYMPRRGKSSSIMPDQAFVSRILFPSGVFSIQSDFDMNYAIIPLHLSRELLKYRSSMVSYLEIKIEEGADVFDLQEELKLMLGDDFIVENQLEQNATLYQVMRMESWAVYFILSLILVIAVFNIAGFLVMLVLDKKQDIFILKSMGADNSLIKNIFLYEGLTISFIGCLIGVVLSFILISLQQHFGFVKIPGATFVVSAYPFDMRLQDFIVVVVTVLGISFTAAYLPTRKLKYFRT